MTPGRVAPVDDARGLDAARPADVGRVQVVVLHGVGHAHGRELDAPGVQVGQDRGQPVGLLRGEPAVGFGHGGQLGVQRPGQRGRGGRAHLCHSGCQHRVAAAGQHDLRLGVAGDDALPGTPQPVWRRVLAQHRPAVPADRPPAARVDGQHLGDQTGDPLVDEPHEGRLLGGPFAVHLEPDAAARRLEPDRARPDPRVRLLPLARQPHATVGQLLGDPRLRLLVEGGAGPQVEGHAPILRVTPRVGNRVSATRRLGRGPAP